MSIANMTRIWPISFIAGNSYKSRQRWALDRIPPYFKNFVRLYIKICRTRGINHNFTSFPPPQLIAPPSAKANQCTSLNRGLESVHFHPRNSKWFKRWAPLFVCDRRQTRTGLWQDQLDGQMRHEIEQRTRDTQNYHQGSNRFANRSKR